MGDAVRGNATTRIIRMTTFDRKDGWGSKSRGRRRKHVFPWSVFIWSVFLSVLSVFLCVFRLPRCPKGGGLQDISKPLIISHVSQSICTSIQMIHGFIDLLRNDSYKNEILTNELLPNKKWIIGNGIWEMDYREMNYRQMTHWNTGNWKAGQWKMRKR